jgi:hypothetical protein
MNMALIKKTGSAFLMSICFTVSAGAQNIGSISSNSSLSTSAAPAPANVPQTGWPYALPPLKTPATPSIELNSAYYLPWIGQNLYLLASYAILTYQMQQNDLTNTGGNTASSAFSAATLSANNQLSTQMDTNTQTASATTASQYQQVLTFFPNTTNFSTYAQLPGTDITIPCQPNALNCNAPTNAQFNADTLLSTTGYVAKAQQTGQTDQTTISTLINFLANLNQSLPNPGFTATDTPAARSALLQRGDVQSYILAIRNIGALQSMALSNFNMLAQERLIVPNLGTNAGMTTLPPAGSSTPPSAIKDASQLQLDKFLIDRRVNNAAWYTAMNTASPTALQRETVFILAEMQRQLYELRMLNERMLATLSTMQMTMLQLGTSQLTVQAQNIEQATATNAATTSASQ